VADLHYETAGTGAPVLLLHGFATDLHVWDAQVAALASRYRIIRYDMRGFGRSAAPSAPYTHADDLKSLVDRFGIERAALVGLSLGGGAAINFAIAYPDLVRGLVVVDPVLGGFRWSADFTAAQAAIRAAALDSGVEAARARWLSLPIFTLALANPASADRIRALVGAYSGWHWLNPDPGRPFTPPAIGRLGEIRAPTLIVVGELDTPDFQAIAATLEHGIAGAKKVTLPGVGHLANLEAPDRFNDIVLTFLAEVDAHA
jgi:3-oxoadipate enol-lactonase